MSWITINALLRRGNSWSGHERHCGYLNIGEGPMINVSSVTGLDFEDDGRGLALTDWDRDGDWDLWITNRNAPSVRVLQNEAGQSRPSLALRLTGKTCNRDAIGARVTLIGRKPISTQTIRAGEGFVSQSSKWLTFGLGDDPRLHGIEIRWPDGKFERLTDVRSPGRYQITQGAGRAHKLEGDIRAPLSSNEPITRAPLTASSRTIAYSRLPFPTANLKDLNGKILSVGDRKTPRPQFIHLWASWCPNCQEELREFTARRRELQAQGLQVFSVNTDLLDPDTGSEAEARRTVEDLKVPFPVVWATDAFIETLEAVQRVLRDEQTPLPLPSSFLLDATGRVAVLYRGPVSLDQLVKDLEILKTPAGQLGAIAQPFPGKRTIWPNAIDPIQVALKLYEGNDRSLVTRYLGQLIEIAETKAPGHHSMDAGGLHYFMGTLLEEANQAERSIMAYQFAIKRDPKHFRAHRNLARQLARTGKAEQAVAQFQQALALRPNDESLRFEWTTTLYQSGQTELAVKQLRQFVSRHPRDVRGLRLLAWVLATAQETSQRNGAQALQLAQAAIPLSPPNDPVAGDVLAAAYAEAGQFDKATETIRAAIAAAEKSPALQSRVPAMKQRLAAFSKGQAWRGQ